MSDLHLLHHNLNSLGFYERYKIKPYFHNRNIENIMPNSSEATFTSTGKTGYYTIMRGRMGNGDCRIKLKVRGKSIILIRYSTDGGIDPKYVGSLPSEWLGISKDKLSIEVERFFNWKYVSKNLGIT